jgi:hypothetical protein
MNCPLIQPKIEHEKGEEMVRMGRCTQEECAWWDAPMTQCNFVAISLRLGAIFEQLAIIQNKMPHKEE